MELMFPKLHERECLELHFNEPTLEKLSRWKENTEHLDKIAVNRRDQTSCLCLCSTSTSNLISTIKPTQ